MRLRTLPALGLVVLVAALLVPSTASAASPAAQQYPPSTCSTLSVSTQNPSAGQAIIVSGAGFKADVSVHLVLSPTAPGSITSARGTSADAVRRTFDLGEVTTSATGAFSATIRLPSAITNAGHYYLIALSGFVTASIDGACAVDPYQVVDIHASATSPVSATAGATSQSSGGTAFTGVDIAGLLVIGVLLVAAGVLFARRGLPSGRDHSA